MRYLVFEVCRICSNDYFKWLLKIATVNKSCIDRLFIKKPAVESKTWLVLVY